MGKREFITGGVVVLAMAVGFGGMLAARLRKIGDKTTQSADDQGVKDALAAFRSEKKEGFPAKSSLMDFRDSAPSAPPTSPAPADATAATSPSASAPQSGAIPATADTGLQAAPTSSAQSAPPAWAGSNPGADRYGAVAATDPTAPGPAAGPTAPGIDPNMPPVADLNSNPSGGDPFRRSTMGAATLGAPTDQGAPPNPGPSAYQGTPPSNAAASNAADPTPAVGSTTWPPTNDPGATAAATPANPTPQADQAGTPGMMPLQPLPAAVTRAAAQTADPDPRYDYRRRDYRDPVSDATTPIPPAAAPGSTDAQAQYQYVSPTSPSNAAPPPSRRAQYDMYGREINRDPDPTNSDASTQAPPSQPPYSQPANSPPPTPVADAWPANQPRGPRDGEPETYTLGPNENYWTISQKVYGTSAYFKAIEEHNRERYPYSDQLRVGDVISIPPMQVLLDKYPDLCPKQRQAPGSQGQGGALQVGMRSQIGGRVYKVQKGDSLFDIARDELGKASRWAEIYELNRDVIGSNVDMLSPGMELRLPGDRDARSDPLTTQSRQPLNR